METREKHFRPSCLPALNTRLRTSEFFLPFYEKVPNEIVLPLELTATPEETVLNYFSILREAENFDLRACGSIGEARLPFPIAYNFLSEEYKQRLSYNEYLASFSGIGHTSLIKLKRIPDGRRGIKYFYEIETIEGMSGKQAEYFGYYYGFIKLAKTPLGYRITNIEKFPEDFLCAPYHGWDHDAEAVVGVKYGWWRKLIKKNYAMVQNGYVKNIYFHGTDGADYTFIFFELTNGTDVEIAQFRKGSDGSWKQIRMTPEIQCLDKK
ncbi:MULTISPECIES: hypothetical protein [unclassified Bacillus (in: firmicutes)]|uniref:hypothetical protein n=1 Tax=unclassified Bacillus (in: firmicutes) TaxID=185979 RepID=UPI000B865863|nr:MULTISPECIES: hypothetical protein [unclassified Bacillus (in: firmicutes)]